MTSLTTGGRSVPRDATARLLFASERSGDAWYASQRQSGRGTRSMQIYVARLNIEHFRRQIAAETDPRKQKILRRSRPKRSRSYLVY